MMSNASRPFQKSICFSKVVLCACTGHRRYPLLDDEALEETPSQVDNALRIWQYKATWTQLADQKE